MESLVPQNQVTLKVVAGNCKKTGVLPKNPVLWERDAPEIPLKVPKEYIQREIEPIMKVA
jgi:hypothetical protein